MLDADTLRFTIFVYQPEPFLYTFEQFHRRSESFEILSAQFDPGLAGFVKHKFHIAENVAGILTYCNVITFLPELLRFLSDSLNEAEFLHVAWRQCAVEVVDKCYDRSFSHDSEYKCV